MKLRTGNPWMSGADYGRSLSGMSINLLVRQMAPALRFAREVLRAEVVYADVDFAVLQACGMQWMLHADHCYDQHPMRHAVAGDAPRGQGLATERWLQTQKARLLNCAHHHLIFTIPHELNDLWMFNRTLMAQLLFGAVRDTLHELLGDPKYLGATPAFILALHTWGRSLVLHPHIHALVADGGLTEAGDWAHPARSHFLPARVVMMLFRGKFLAALKRAIGCGQLCLPPQQSLARFTTLLNKLGRVKWNVRLCTRYAHGAGVTTYLARYVRGGALKNSQIVKLDPSGVTLRYHPHRNDSDPQRGPRLLRLTPDQFFARYLPHLPTPGLHSLRAYGLYAHTRRESLDQACERLGQPPVEAPVPLTPQTYLARFANAHANTRCPHCGHALITVSLPTTHATGPPSLPH